MNNKLSDRGEKMQVPSIVDGNISRTGAWNTYQCVAVPDGEDLERAVGRAKPPQRVLTDPVLNRPFLICVLLQPSGKRFACDQLQRDCPSYLVAVAESEGPQEEIADDSQRSVEWDPDR